MRMTRQQAAKIIQALEFTIHADIPDERWIEYTGLRSWILWRYQRAWGDPVLDKLTPKDTNPAVSGHGARAAPARGRP